MGWWPLPAPRSGVGGADDEEATREALAGAEVRFGQVTQLESLLADGGRGESFDAVVCCLASRTGGVADSWRIDHQATANAIAAAQRLGVRQFVLLSAICVQKPLLAFQKAKAKVEEELKASGLTWSIVRPTAFFKSLAAQVEPVRRGCPYVMFDDGQQAACTPISEEDLAEYMADCLERPELQNRVLPIGGPGPALTARQQGELLFSLLQRPPRFLSVSSGTVRRGDPGFRWASSAGSRSGRHPGICPHRALLRHGIHAGVGSASQGLLCGGNAIHRNGHLGGFLQANPGRGP